MLCIFAIDMFNILTSEGILGDFDGECVWSHFTSVAAEVSTNGMSFSNGSFIKYR